MITLRKLSSLSEANKLAKCARLLDAAAIKLFKKEHYNKAYLKGVCSLILNSNNEKIKNKTKLIASKIITEEELSYSLVNDLSLALHSDLDLDWADWDLVDSDEILKERQVFPFKIVLDRLRSPFNVGSIFRTADSFGVEEILLFGPTSAIEHRRAQRSARGSHNSVSYQNVDEKQLLETLKDQNVFALETKGTSIDKFEFPPNGVAIIGNEEFGVSPLLLEVAEKSLGRVSIDLYGSKGSLNVSVAFGILMYNWHTQVLKQKENNR